MPIFDVVSDAPFPPVDSPILIYAKAPELSDLPACRSIDGIFANFEFIVRHPYVLVRPDSRIDGNL